MKKIKKLIVTILSMTVVICLALGSASAAPVAECAGKVACDLLNVRERPDTDSAVLTMLAQGDTVVILDKPDSDWYHVSAYGTIGYVKASYIAEVEAAKNFTATGALNGSDIRMRNKPNTSADILGTYQSGTAMSVIGINNGWYKVQYDGNTGYIRSDFLDLTGGGAQVKATSEGQKIAEFAKQYIGYAYIYGAESPEVGFDCSGLAYYVYGKFGYSISRTASQQYANDGVKVSKSELKPGDLVFFSSNGGYSVTHVGLYIGGGDFVNPSTSKTGVILSSLDSDWYTKTWYGAKRIVS